MKLIGFLVLLLSQLFLVLTCSSPPDQANQPLANTGNQVSSQPDIYGNYNRDTAGTVPPVVNSSNKIWNSSAAAANSARPLRDGRNWGTSRSETQVIEPTGGNREPRRGDLPSSYRFDANSGSQTAANSVGRVPVTGDLSDSKSSITIAERDPPPNSATNAKPNRSPTVVINRNGNGSVNASATNKP